MKLKVSITQEDIDNGVQRNCTQCPGALAIKRRLSERFPGKEWIAFTGTYDGHVFCTPYVWYDFSTPDPLRDFIYYYDARGYADPITFTLDLKKCPVHVSGT